MFLHWEKFVAGWPAERSAGHISFVRFCNKSCSPRSPLSADLHHFLIHSPQQLLCLRASPAVQPPGHRKRAVWGRTCVSWRVGAIAVLVVAPGHRQNRANSAIFYRNLYKLGDLAQTRRYFIKFIQNMQTTPRTTPRTNATTRPPPDFYMTRSL